MLDSVESNLNICPRQVRDKSESKYQRVQDKSEMIEKRLESGLEYYSPSHKTETIQCYNALLKHVFLFINMWVYIQNEVFQKYIPDRPTKVPNSIQIQTN